MAEEGTILRLQDANKQYVAKNYSDTLKILLNAPKDDPVVKQNIAMLEYVTRHRDAAVFSAQIQRLVEPLPANGTSDHAGGAPAAVVGGYEGSESAQYNRAIALLHSGAFDEGIAILRELVKVGVPDVPLAVVCRAVSVLYSATTPRGSGANKKKASRSQQDEELFRRTIAQNVGDFRKDPAMSRMLAVAMADSTSIHEQFRTATMTDADRVTYHNNLGVMALADGKLGAAALYLASALQTANDDVSACVFTKHSVYRNAGLCALLRQDYKVALQYLLAAQDTMKQSVTLWLRVCEAAVGLVAELQAERGAANYDQSQAAVAAAATLPACFALLHIPTFDQMVGCPRVDDPTEAWALDAAGSAIARILGSLLIEGASLFDSLKALADAGRATQVTVLQYTLANACYLALLKQNYNVAARIGSDLIALHRQKPFPVSLYTSITVWTTEALCHISKPGLAIKTLQSVSFSEMLTDSADLAQRLRVESLLINLAVSHILQQSWRSALALITTLVARIASDPAGSTVVSRIATILQVYVELAQGNKEKALENFNKGPLPLPRYPAGLSEKKYV